jgi:beta-ketoacyl-acyl-carrier-protein synthase II
MSNRRVVITGLGTVNPMGNSVDVYWEGLKSGTSGIGRITNFDASDLPCQIAGEVKDFDPTKYMDRKDARRAARSTQFALAATMQAVADAGLPSTMPEPERVGVMIGTGVGGVEKIILTDHVLHEKSYRQLNPFQMPAGIPNIPAFQIAQVYQCLGPNNTTTTACAAGTQAVGEGVEMIRRGAADIVISGGTEAIIFQLTIGGFSAMRAIPFNYNDKPEKASRPFDADREGFVLSEGAAILVLEDLDHALNRGARIYAEVAGHASSSDAFHVAALKPDGLGPVRAMRWAIENAGLELDDIDYINAHGTSTTLNDSIETLAIKKLFGERAYQIPVSSTKSMTGHAMGAAGALEAIACALVVDNDVIPPTINYETPDPECDLDYVPNEARNKEVKSALSNSFGLGGQNACLVVKKYDPINN